MQFYIFKLLTSKRADGVLKYRPKSFFCHSYDQILPYFINDILRFVGFFYKQIFQQIGGNCSVSLQIITWCSVWFLLVAIAVHTVLQLESSYEHATSRRNEMNIFVFNEELLEMQLLLGTQLFWREYANLMPCG